MPPFGRNLQTIRDEKGLSQLALAEKSGLSLRSIQNWEQGHRAPKADAVFMLAKALGVPMESLINEPETKPKKKRKK